MTCRFYKCHYKSPAPGEATPALSPGAIFPEPRVIGDSVGLTVSLKPRGHIRDQVSFLNTTLWLGPYGKARFVVMAVGGTPVF